MSMLAPASPLPVARRSGARARAALQWVQAHRASVAMAGLLAFAGPVTFAAGALAVLPWPADARVAPLLGWWLLYGAALWGTLLAAAHAGRTLARRLPRGLHGAVWLAAALAAAALPALATRGRLAHLLEQGLVHSALTADLYAFTFSVAMALLYFAHLHRSRDHAVAAARLALAQRAQRHARQRLVEARLQEMQARLDPRLLLDLLGVARDHYARDAAGAERFLDDVIAFLRLALPRLKNPSSTLLQEAKLASAFVALYRPAATAPPSFEVQIAPEAMHARFPPGVLVPLLAPTARAGRHARLKVTRTGAACRVALDLPTPPPPEALARVRAWLAEVAGAGSDLALVTTDATEVTLTVPYEPA